MQAQIVITSQWPPRERELDCQARRKVRSLYGAPGDPFPSEKVGKCQAPCPLNKIAQLLFFTLRPLAFFLYVLSSLSLTTRRERNLLLLLLATNNQLLPAISLHSFPSSFPCRRTIERRAPLYLAITLPCPNSHHVALLPCVLYFSLIFCRGRPTFFSTVFLSFRFPHTHNSNFHPAKPSARHPDHTTCSTSPSPSLQTTSSIPPPTKHYSLITTSFLLSLSLSLSSTSPIHLSTSRSSS